MVLVEVACKKCGLVRLEIKKFSLFVEKNGESFFTFLCQSCREVNKYPADDYIVEVLTFNGILPHLWEPVKELYENKKGSPISVDDLLDFHLALKNSDWFNRLLFETKKDRRKR